MRILFAHSFYRVPGGEDRHVKAQVELVARSHDVRLISESNVDLSPSVSTAARMVYSRGKKQEVRAVIDEFVPDVVHIHNTYPSFGPAVHLAARERRIPVVMTVHNMRLRCPNGLMFTEGSLCRRCEPGVYVHGTVHRCFPRRTQSVAYGAALWAHRFAMQLERQVARFIAPSDFMHRRLLEWRLAPDRIRVIRHFVGSTNARGSRVVPGKYGIYLGRLSPEKGLEVLLGALRRAGDLPFVFVGDGTSRRALERLASDLGLANTRFVGALQHHEGQSLLAEARYMAITSIGEETASLAALEALSLGRPLLVSNRGALPELVTRGEGLICQPEDELDTCDKLLRLARSDALFWDASRAAVRTASTVLRPERHLAQLEGVYVDVTARPRGS